MHERIIIYLLLRLIRFGVIMLGYIEAIIIKWCGGEETKHVYV